MMKELDLYIDYDGVIKNTIPLMKQVVEWEKIINDDFKTVELLSKIDWKYIIDNSEYINNSIENIKKIIDSGLFRVHILTHFNCLDEIEYKTMDIRDNQIYVPVIGVSRRICKTYQVPAKGAILVDDTTRNLISWEKAGGVSIKFLSDPSEQDCSWPIIDDLSKLIDLFKVE